MTQKFFYDASNTPVVNSITPSVLSVLGGQQVTIAGANLPVPIGLVLIGKQYAKVISSTSSQLIIESPSQNPGLYDLAISAGTLGNIRVSTQIEYKLYVTSISPQVGSIRGGQLVNIYGEGFR